MEDLFRNLVAIPTVSGDESSDAALSYIADYLDQRGMYVHRYRSNGFGSLVATTKKDAKHVKLLLAAHIDVVPAPDELFRLRTHQGQYRGRGVFDMKFAIAAYMHAIDSLQKKLGQYDIGIMITSDEEIAGQNGVKYLLERGYGADVCLLPDGADGWHVEAQCKGVWHVRATAEGESAHGSRPWEGENAADKLLQFVNAVQNYVPMPQKHTDTTVVLTQLQTGTANNQLPDEATAVFDIRFLNGTYNDLKRQLRTFAKAYDVRLKTEMFSEAVHHDMDSPYVAEWEKVVKRVRGETKNEYALSFGASDARYLVASGIPTIVTRPDGGNQHGDNEWIDKKGTHEFAECVMRYIKNIATDVKPVDSEGGTAYNTSKLPKTATSRKS